MGQKTPHELIKPPALKPGDTIGIVTPASDIKPHLLSAGCAELERLGFEVRYRDDIYTRRRFTAGTLERRRDEFLERASEIFATRPSRGDEQERIAELERVLGRKTMELEAAKKASDILNSLSKRKGR